MKREELLQLTGLSAQLLDRLVEAARSVSSHAYCPYSNFHVGAALALRKDDNNNLDTIITGCNVENASYGLTICAERAAICRAISETGSRGFLAIVIYTPDGGGFATPCGSCRQFLIEFSPDIWVITSQLQREGATQEFHLWTAAELLPHYFSAHNIFNKC